MIINIHVILIYTCISQDLTRKSETTLSIYKRKKFNTGIVYTGGWRSWEQNRGLSTEREVKEAELQVRLEEPGSPSSIWNHDSPVQQD